MAGFKKNSKKENTKSPKKETSKNSKKEYKVTPVQKKSKEINAEDVSNVVTHDVTVPNVVQQPSAKNKIDLFIVHAFGYDRPSEFIPYFIGKRIVKDYSEVITNSSPNSDPSDIIDNDVKVVSLNKRGGY